MFFYSDFTQTPSSMAVKEGLEAEISCVASEIPQQVRWFKNNNEITADDIKYSIT